MSNYKLEYNPNYYSNGCDCCEPTEMEGWDVYYDGELICTSNDIQDALTFILARNGIAVEIDYGE